MTRIFIKLISTTCISISLITILNLNSACASQDYLKLCKQRFSSAFFKNIFSSNFEYFAFHSKLGKMCACLAQWEAKNDEFISRQFLYRAKFDFYDQCAIENLSERQIIYFYTITTSTELYDFLINKLENLYPGDVKTVATEHSLYLRKSCLHQKILSKCTKIKSLGPTYQCLNRTLNSPDERQEMLSTCPSLVAKGNDPPAMRRPANYNQL